jgi:hypothetical protein
MTELVLRGKLLEVTGWVRRTYHDRRYVDGARHAVVEEEAAGS